MDVRRWIAMGVVLVFAGWLGAACSNAAESSDAGLSDGEDGADLDPCAAAAPLWNEIWRVRAEAFDLPGTTPQTNLIDVWGFGPDDMYAVGFSGTILHHDGTGWSQMQTSATADLEGIWGYQLEDQNGEVTRTDIFVVGSDGTILRYDGNAWSPQLVINDPDPDNPDPQTVSGTFHDVWGIPARGTGPEDHPTVVAVGGDGLIVRYDGVTNRFLEMRNRQAFTDSEGNIRYSYVRWTSERLGGVFGTGSIDDPLFVTVGNNGTILELSGDTWTRVDASRFTPPGAFTTHLNGVWGRGSWELFAVGLDGTALRRDNGGVWHVLKKENELWDIEPVYLRGFWGFYQSRCGELPEPTDGGEPPVREDTSWAIFVGWNGTVLLGHDGIICKLQVPTQNRLESVWGQHPRPESERLIDGGTTDGGVECDPVEVIITGVNGTLLRLSNPEGR